MIKSNNANSRTAIGLKLCMALTFLLAASTACLAVPQENSNAAATPESSSDSTDQTSSSANDTSAKSHSTSQKSHDKSHKKHKTSNKCFVWKVIAKDNSYFYLMGSMHMVRQATYPLEAAIEKAFYDSDMVAVEVNQKELAPNVIQSLVVKKGMYPRGDSLSAHISKETKEKLDEFTKKGALAMLAPQLQFMKPWLVALTIEVMGMKELGFDPTLGIDKHFENEAEMAKKPVQGLETAEFQTNLISGFDDDFQEKMLKATLIDLKEWASSIQEIDEAWSNGDVKAMDALVTKSFTEHPDLLPLQKVLIDDRNLTMLKSIEDIAHEKHQCFVIVGAAHLVGKKGLLQLLRNDHYKLVQVEKS